MCTFTFTTGCTPEQILRMYTSTLYTYVHFTAGISVNAVSAGMLMSQ